jgi:hypothetical protein
VKPAAKSSDAVPERRHRRGVRLFVALHLGAVGTIYAIALVVGGGFAGTPMPPITTAMASPDHVPATLPEGAETLTTDRSVAPVPVPDWTQRTEIAAPWEQR